MTANRVIDSVRDQSVNRGLRVPAIRTATPNASASFEVEPLGATRSLVEARPLIVDEAIPKKMKSLGLVEDDRRGVREVRTQYGKPFFAVLQERVEIATECSGLGAVAADVDVADRQHDREPAKTALELDVGQGDQADGACELVDRRQRWHGVAHVAPWYVTGLRLLTHSYALLDVDAGRGCVTFRDELVHLGQVQSIEQLHQDPHVEIAVQVVRTVRARSLARRMPRAPDASTWRSCSVARLSRGPDQCWRTRIGSAVR